MVSESQFPKAPIPVLVGMIVRNKELLLSKYSLPSVGDSWNPPSFFLKFGEDPSTQLKRELLNRFHLLTEVLTLLQASNSVVSDPQTGKTRSQLLLFYRVRPVRGLNFLKSQEISWASLDTLETYGPVYPTREVFSHLLKV